MGRGAQATRTAGKVAKAIKEAEEAAGRADAAWKASNLTPNNLVLRGEAEKAQKVAVDRAAQVDKNMVKQATAARVAKEATERAIAIEARREATRIIRTLGGQASAQDLRNLDEAFAGLAKAIKAGNVEGVRAAGNDLTRLGSELGLPTLAARGQLIAKAPYSVLAKELPGDVQTISMGVSAADEAAAILKALPPADRHLVVNTANKQSVTRLIEALKPQSWARCTWRLRPRPTGCGP